MDATMTEARTGASEQVNSQELEHDPVLWFDDGSVLLIAGQTAFRVHRGILAMRSEIFRDLFTVPQPAGAEQMEGCPVVRLQDSPQELCTFLRVLYDGLRYFNPEQMTRFHIVAAILRLACKYEVADLRVEALGRMKATFPTYFAVWDTASADTVKRLGPDVIKAVNLARVVGTDSVLPTALYACCQLDADVLINGIPLAEGETGETERLSPADVARCVEAKPRLTSAAHYVRAQILEDGEPDEGCVHPDTCRRALQQAARSNRTLEFMQAGADTDPLGEGALERAGLDMQLRELCDGCFMHLRRKEQSVRRYVWTKLPAMFGLSEGDCWDKHLLIDSDDVGEEY